MSATSTRTLVLIALMTALTAVVTYYVKVPVGAGYFNFSDAAVYIAAFLLGPVGGLIAGGVGPALADLAAGYASFAPLTFAAHGLQGLVAGYLALAGTRRSRLVAALVGTLCMAGIYFVGEYFGAAMGWGGPAQATLELPFNLLQNIGGAIVAIPLVELLQRAYPQAVRR